ncbi:MAG: homoserine O-acetyltransferase [Bacteroidota bacterium]
MSNPTPYAEADKSDFSLDKISSIIVKTHLTSDGFFYCPWWKKIENMEKQTKTYRYEGTLELESGNKIRDFDLTYTVWGKLSEKKDNAVWIFHGMTANSDPSEWWPGMVGNGKFFDPARCYIICVNMPGSCYGSVGPLSTNPETGKPYLHAFPFFSSLDTARAFDALRKELQIEKIFMGIGASMGGQQLLSWATENPDLFEHMVPISTNAFHSPWGKAFNASQRMSIENDASWKTDTAAAGMEGMKVARSIALLSYRHYEAYDTTQQDADAAIEHTRSESYQRYQGEKLAKRFNAISYYALTKSMDSHHLGRGTIKAENKLATIRSKTLIIGISSDLLFPIIEQQWLAAHIPHADLAIIDSIYGHDGFLLENDKITALLNKLISQ